MFTVNSVCLSWGIPPGDIRLLVSYINNPASRKPFLWHVPPQECFEMFAMKEYVWQVLYQCECSTWIAFELGYPTQFMWILYSVLYTKWILPKHLLRRTKRNSKISKCSKYNILWILGSLLHIHYDLFLFRFSTFYWHVFKNYHQFETHFLKNNHVALMITIKA